MIPAIEIGGETFLELFTKARKRLPVLYPEWTNFNANDTGITLLELFAWMKEMQEFHMNQIGERHYETYLKLLGLRPGKKCPAHAIVCCFGEIQSQILPCRSHFAAGNIPFESVEDIYLFKGRIRAVTACGENRELDNEENLNLPVFGRPPGRSEPFELIFDTPFEPGQAHHLYFGLRGDGGCVRNPFPEAEFCPLVHLVYEYRTDHGWEKCSVLRDDTKGLLQSGIVSVFISSNSTPHKIENNGYPVRIRLIEGEYDLLPVLDCLYVNPLELEQLRTVIGPGGEGGGEIGEGTGFPNQKLYLGIRSILADSVRLSIEQPGNPDCLEVWSRVDDFMASRPEDRHFVVHEEEGIVQFGNGLHGMAPEGRIWLTGVKQTLGTAGNVKKGQIRCAQENGGVQGTHIDNAAGGQDEETVEACFSRFQRELLSRQCAVTNEDYENIVRMTPGLAIRNVKAVCASMGENSVDIVVQPYSCQEKAGLSSAYVRNIMQYIEKRRLIGTNVRILSPEYIRVSIYMELELLAYYRNAQELIQKKLKDFFSNSQAEFGKPILHGTVYGFLESIECVKKLHSLTVNADGLGIARNRSGDVLLPPNGVAYLSDIQCSVTFSG